ncbi:MAG: hypothetical protein M3163_04590, partial [Actinomycetota bacterium]|nr:hypothetical protein [Actinomycetota bacterium]
RAAAADMGVRATVADLPPELTITADGAFWSPFGPTVRDDRVDMDLLVTRTSLKDVDFFGLVQLITRELDAALTDRQVRAEIAQGLTTSADPTALGPGSARAVATAGGSLPWAMVRADVPHGWVGRDLVPAGDAGPPLP